MDVFGWKRFHFARFRSGEFAESYLAMLPVVNEADSHAQELSHVVAILNCFQMLDAKHSLGFMIGSTNSLGHPCRPGTM